MEEAGHESGVHFPLRHATSIGRRIDSDEGRLMIARAPSPSLEKKAQGYQHTSRSDGRPSSGSKMAAGSARYVRYILVTFFVSRRRHGPSTIIACTVGGAPVINTLCRYLRLFTTSLAPTPSSPLSRTPFMAASTATRQPRRSPKLQRAVRTAAAPRAEAAAPLTMLATAPVEIPEAAAAAALLPRRSTSLSSAPISTPRTTPWL